MAYVGTSVRTEPSGTRVSLEVLVEERVVFVAVSLFVDGVVFPVTVNGGGTIFKCEALPLLLMAVGLKHCSFKCLAMVALGPRSLGGKRRGEDARLGWKSG